MIPNIDDKVSSIIPDFNDKVSYSMFPDPGDIR